MTSFGDDFLSRDDGGLADRLDERVDLLAGLRVPNLAAAANLRMSARAEGLQRWRLQRPEPWGMSAALACAAVAGLKADPLFAGQFDGRDRLVVPDRPTLGVGLDSGDHARILTFPDAGGLAPDELAGRIDRSLAAGRSGVAGQAPVEPGGQARSGRSRRRWLRMTAQQARERFDYLLPAAQARRFDRVAAERGHFQVHNLGSRGVQEFKGFLRRPALASLWALEVAGRVEPDGRGGFTTRQLLPLVLVYAQELITVDRACRFLAAVISFLEEGP